MPTGTPNRVEKLASGLLRQGNVAGLESEMDRFDRADLSESELESWYYLRGIAAFRSGDRPLAMLRFKEAHAAFPKSGEIAFSLGQEYEGVGDVESMFELFDSVLFPNISAQYALMQSRYSYLWGDLQRAVFYIQPVLEAHFQLGIADDTFLWMRGMPFFSQTWAYMAAFAELTGDLENLEALTEKAISDLKDCDLTYLTDFLFSMKQNDFSKYEAFLNHGTGYQRTRAAVIRAHRQNEYSNAQEVLGSVALGEKDFSWLNDILLLGHCEAAHRLHPQAEAQLIERFLLRQQLLFEPDHAVNFRLLEYQELLKPIYQARRRVMAQ
jgi:tetratricopeptide (TPR) repeat protein